VGADGASLEPPMRRNDIALVELEPRPGAY
jgi:hypothetical protein